MTVRRIFKAISWVLGAAIFFSALGFAHSKSGDVRINPLTITINHPKDQYFLTREEVYQLVNKQYDTLVGKPLELINSRLLEESIENHPFIRNAEVYFTLNGAVCADVEQHRVIARVQDVSGEMYMNSFGKPVPLSSNHSADVPMISGYINQSHWNEAYSFLQDLSASRWLNGKIEALVREEDGRYLVYPRFSHHKIYWGGPGDTESKIEKLEVFYRYLTLNNKLDSVRTIDVRYKGQVVSTNH